MIFGMGIVPHENRRAYCELRDSMGRDAFVDHIWAEREKAQPFTPSIGKWPRKMGAQKAAAPLSQQPKATVSQIRGRK